MSKLRFLHFVWDDKFTNDSIRCFENSNVTDNIYCCIRKKNVDFDFIDYEKVQKVSKRQCIGIISKEKPDVIVLHCLYALPFDVILKIPNSIKIIWYAWGFDLYSNPYPIGPLIPIENRYGNLTQKELGRYSINTCIRNGFRIIKSIIKNERVSKSMILSVIKRIDYFAGVFPSEYDLLKEKYTFFRAKKVTHNYIHPEEFQQKDLLAPVCITDNNVMLGNSASLLGNHLDLLCLLEDKIRDDVRIICPLSYAGTKRYVDEVIKRGREIYGDRFVPIVDYLPLKDYTQLMNSCSSVVIGLQQQAATCNCLTALWNGLILYLPISSMNYKQYKDMGLNVFSIENDFGKNITLSYDDILHNRKIIEENYSYRVWIDDLKSCVSLIKNDIK